MNTSSNAFWQSATEFRDFELRSHLFRPEQRPLYFQYLGLRPDSLALDAGCGTGVFTRYLAQGLDEGRILGCDISEAFLAYGREQLRALGLERKARLDWADGYRLPYAADAFDAVTNYTYLGVLSDPEAGLRELIRVCRPGGVISCVVATTQIPGVHWQGDYPFPEADELQRLAEWEHRLFTLGGSGAPAKQTGQSWHAFRYPKLFAHCGLREIHLYPMAHLLCFDDPDRPREERRRLALAETDSEIAWLHERYAQKKESYAQSGFGPAEYERLRRLLQRKRAYLAEHFGEDESFEWFGGYHFIVAGVKPKGADSL